MNKRLKIITLFLPLLLCVAVIGGCSNKATGGGGTADGQASPYYGDKVTIKMLRIGNEQDPQSDRILLELQKRVNINLEIIGMAWDQGDQKVNMMMSAGDRIDLLNYDPGASLNSWAKGGMVYSYEELIRDSNKYPLIKSVIDSEIYKDLKIDGKSYIRPFALSKAHFGILIRQDWLDNLGLSIPSTIDELITVLRAFTFDDPEGTGKNNTLGTYMRTGGDGSNPSGMGLMGVINRAYAINAGVNSWIEQPDGSLMAWEATEAAKKATKVINQIVDEGLINSDFLSLVADPTEGLESDEFAIGSHGISNGMSIPANYIDKLAQENPDAKVSFFPPLKGENGVPRNSSCSAGFWRGSIIPKTSERPDRVLDLLEYATTFEGRELTQYGIEGIHFSNPEDKPNGIKVYTLVEDEVAKDWNVNANGYIYPLSWDGFNFWEHAYLPIKEYDYNYDEAFANIIWLVDSTTYGNPLLDDWLSLCSEYSIPSPLQSVQDEGLIRDNKKLQSIFLEGWVKAVVAEPSEFDAIWDAMLVDWLANGGQAKIDYANSIYNK